MAKDGTIILRVSAEAKATLQAAAIRSGRTLTAFVTEAALERAERENTTGETSDSVSPFMAAILSIQYGGSGYDLVARTVWRTITGDPPSGTSVRAWRAQGRALKAALAAEDVDSVWSWLTRNFPVESAAIPGRRRKGFLAGLIAVAADDARG